MTTRVNAMQDPWYEPGDWRPLLDADVPPPIKPLEKIPLNTAAPTSGSETRLPVSTPQAGWNYMQGYTPMPYVAAGKSPKSDYDDTPATAWTPGGKDYSWRYGSPADFRKAAYNKSRSYAAGGSSAPAPRATRTVSRTIYTRPRPDMPNLPKLKMPQVNKRAIRALQQKHAAPGIRKLRESMQMALAQGSDNPNVRRMTIREALQGYGTGLESVMQGAYGTARSEHMADIQQQSQEAQLNWQAEVARQNALYNSAMQDYLASATRVTTTGPTNEVGVPSSAGLRGAYAALIPFRGSNKWGG